MFGCRVFENGFSRQPHLLALMPDARFSCVSLTQVWGAGHGLRRLLSSLSAAARAALGCRETRRWELSRPGCSHFCVGSWGGGTQPVLPSFVAWSLAGEPEHHLHPSPREARREVPLHTQNGGETSGPLPTLGVKKRNSPPGPVGMGAYEMLWPWS